MQRALAIAVCWVGVATAWSDEKSIQIVLVATKYDHPWASHMYGDVCKILADCLNRQEGVRAVVCPDMDWPTDESLFDAADAIVYYARPAGDIVLSPAHREKTEKLLARKIGYSAIHWATAAELDVGPRYQDVLGGWFHFQFSGLNVSKRLLEQPSPTHPISRGWSAHDLHDEFYLNLRFHKDVTPIARVSIDDREQVVAWGLTREDGGRSFGTTLGHFHENFAREPFRRLVVNGILWSAGVEVPEQGADVMIDPALLRLDESKRPAETK
jgi:type 1 glutamine amidotransferase